MYLTKNVRGSNFVEIKIIDDEYDSDKELVEVSLIGAEDERIIIHKEDIYNDFKINYCYTKREFCKRALHYDDVKINCRVWLDENGLYLEAYALWDFCQDYDTILFSNNHFPNHNNELKLLNECEKVYHKLLNWNYDVSYDTEVVFV